MNVTVALSNGSNPTGTITLSLKNSSGETVYTDVLTVAGNGSYATSQGNNPGGYLPTADGDFTWTASYSGDAHNAGVSAQSDAFSGCV
jgi:hypothetical protein